MLDTSALTVGPVSGSELGTAGGGGGAGEITFSGTDREATATLRTRRPLRASARTTVVTRLGGVSSEDPWSRMATNVIAPSLKQKFITLFSSAQTPILYYMAPGPVAGGAARKRQVKGQKSKVKSQKCAGADGLLPQRRFAATAV